MKIVGIKEMQAIDRAATERYGIPSLSLMEQAGEKLAAWVQDVLGFPVDSRVAVLAGSGKNGGDGLVCARYLVKAGIDVTVLLLTGTTLAPETRHNLKRLQKLKINIRTAKGVFPHAWVDDLLNTDLVVDALLGIGLSGAPRPPFSQAIAALTAAKTRVLAVDIPSGLNADTGEPSAATVRADWTITFGLPKHGLLSAAAADYVGRLAIEPIGFPEALLSDRGAEWIYVDEAQAREWLPRRSWVAHKHSAGKVLVIGGSARYHGAPLLAALGAARSGAGFTALAYPKSLDVVLRSHMVEELAHPLPSNAQGVLGKTALAPLLKIAAEYDSLVIGPGMGRDPQTLKLVREFLEQLKGPKSVVVDADALPALVGWRITRAFSARTSLILTPHEGEAGVLLKRPVPMVVKERARSARELAQRYQAVVILKGHHSVIASPEGALWVNGSGSSALATAGTGDVLAGSIAAWVAQKVPPKEATGLGAFLNGVAGDLAGKNSYGLGVRARDVAERIPEAIGTL